VELSRGLESEVTDETGVINRDKSAETPQRGWWQHWVRVLQDETPARRTPANTEAAK
jgi:hypothetical protein